MFYGHIGVALAAKPLVPKVSVGILIVATTAIDTLCGIFTLTGMEWVNRTTGESSLAWSHGLFMSLFWSFVTFFFAHLITKKWKMSFVIAALVFSHWILDFISHPMGMGRVLPKDLPLLFEGSPKVGLGLYYYVIPAIICEFGILLVGIIVYLRTTRLTNISGRWAFALVILLLAIFPIFMKLPEKMSYIATFITLLFLPLGSWMEKYRKYVSFKRNL